MVYLIEGGEKMAAKSRARKVAAGGRQFVVVLAPEKKRRWVMAPNEQEVVYLSAIEPVMTEQQFESRLAGKSENTTIPYMRQARELIVRGLLSRGTDKKQITERKKIIGGSYTSMDGAAEGRVFLMEDDDKVTLLWRGPSREFRSSRVPQSRLDPGG